MALKDLLAAPPVPQYSDKIGRWRSTLDAETRKAFDAAVTDPAWGAAPLARMLTDSGFKISDNAVRAYRERLAREKTA